jgi:hypothetical protein
MGRDLSLPDVVVQRTLAVEAKAGNRGGRHGDVVVLAAVWAGYVVGVTCDRLLVGTAATGAGDPCEFHVTHLLESPFARSS